MIKQAFITKAINNYNITIDSNLCYYNRIGMNMTRDGIPSNPSSMVNMVVTDNTFVARLDSDEVTEFQNRVDAGIDFGTYSGNTLTRPINETTSTLGPIVACENGSCASFPWTSYTLATWKTFSGEDATSTVGVATVPSVDSLRFEVNTTSSPVTVAFGTQSYIDIRTGATYSCDYSLPAFSGLVAIKSATVSCSSVRHKGRIF